MFRIKNKFGLCLLALSTLVVTGCGGGGGGGGGGGAEIATYSVSGTIYYLGGEPGTVSISNNNGTPETISDGTTSFSFSGLDNGAEYDLDAVYSVNSSSIGWDCKVTNNKSGNISGANITDVEVVCGRDVKLNSYAAYVTDEGVVTLLYQAQDSQNNAVSGLTASEFIVLQDGSQVSATESFTEIVPNTDIQYELNTVLMIDISGSITTAQLNQTKQATKSLVVDSSGSSVLLPNQRIAVWVFDGNVTQLQNFTDDHQLLSEKIDSITQTGRDDNSSTNLFGAAIEGLSQWEDQFSSNAIKQGFLVLMTDGDDTSAMKTLAEALAVQGDKRVYTVAIGNAISEDGLIALNQLGNAGYLQASSFDVLAERLHEASERLSNEIESFYYLHYATPARSGSHTVDLKVTDNVYSGAGYMLSGQFTANDGFGVSSSVVLNDTVINVKPEAQIELRARVLWDNPEAPYSYEWSTIPSSASVIENADDTTAVLTGYPVAGIDELTVATTDSRGNAISINVPVNVTEVSVSTPTRLLAKLGSVELTASSSSEIPNINWAATGGCTTSLVTETSITLNAPNYDTTCRLSVTDAAGSAVPYQIDFTVGAPDTTPIVVSGSSGGDYSESTASYSFEDGSIPSSFTMHGDASWVVDSTTGANGTSRSLRAGAIAHDEWTATGLTVSGVNSVSFYYKVESEFGFDYFYFNVNGDTVLYRSGDHSWTSYTYTLPDTGTHTLYWGYNKDDTVSVGQDTAWIDEIVLQ